MHQSTSKSKLTGFLAATYTPMDKDGSLNLAVVAPLVEDLLSKGIAGFYVCGSTGEGMSLSTKEREAVAESYVTAVNHRAPVIVQVGHNSLSEACRLAKHSQKIGANIVSATCPSYFKVPDVQHLIDCMAEISSSAPELPFYYYHIPALTGSSLEITQFMDQGRKRIPNLRGLKYTDYKLHEYQECLEFQDGHFDVVWGCDEMYLGALATGAKAAIGSTYNIALPLYKKIQDAFNVGDVEKARMLQFKAVRLVRVLSNYPFHSAVKVVLGMKGFDCGTCRLPQAPMSENQKSQLKIDLENLGFFEW